MKKLLNNPVVVIGLGVGALAICATNIVLPLLDNHSAAEAVIPLADDVSQGSSSRDVYGVGFDDTEDSGTALEFEPAAANQVLNSIGWNDTPRRNPFRFTVADLAEHDASRVLEDESVTSPEPDHAVSALVVTNNFQIAVVDGQLVRAGSKVQNGRVGAITANAVEVVNKDKGVQLVSLPRGTP